MRNPLVRCLIRNAVAGIAIGWSVASGMLAFDVGGVGALVFGFDPWWLPLGMMLAFFGLTFGSLAMGSAVMMPGHGDGGRRGRVPAQPAVLRRSPALHRAGGP